MNQLQHAFNLFDEYNQKDPRWIIWKNEVYPQEYAHALMLNEWVLSLQPASGEELLLASRCQHIGRWEIPRDSYPDGREAYLKWRKDLAQHHATIAGDLMREARYGENQINRVTEIILKKRIKQDYEVQIMENALCLIFLEHQYEELRLKYLDEPEKMVNILYRSLLKMDKHGHAIAKLLPYTNDGLSLVIKAIERVEHS